MNKNKGPQRPSSSSSSSEDEEETKRLRDALDPTFVKDGGGESDTVPTPTPPKTSVRELMKTEAEEQFPKPYSLNLNVNQQKYLARELYNSLEIEDDKRPLQTVVKEEDFGILLFKCSRKRVKAKDILYPKGEWKETRRKPILRRKRHFDGSESGSEGEEDKCRKVAVDLKWIQNTASLY